MTLIVRSGDTLGWSGTLTALAVARLCGGTGPQKRVPGESAVQPEDSALWHSQGAPASTLRPQDSVLPRCPTCLPGDAQRWPLCHFYSDELFSVQLEDLQALKCTKSWACWHTPVTQALKRLRQEECTSSSRLGWANQQLQT